MSTSVRVISDTVDRTVRRVVVSVTVQLVLERQTAATESYSQYCTTVKIVFVTISLHVINM